MAANLSLLLMANCSEAETFAILECLVSSSAGEKRLHQSVVEEEDFAAAFLEVTRERHPQLVAHLEHCGREQVLAMVRAWFSSFFYGWLPFGDVVRVVDAFLSEGDKVLVRLGMAWLRARKRALKACRNADEVELCLRAWVMGPDACAKVGASAEAAFPYSFDALARHGFELKRLSREAILAQVRRARVRRTGGGGGGVRGAASGRSVSSEAASRAVSLGGETSAGEKDDEDDEDEDGLVMLTSAKTDSAGRSGSGPGASPAGGIGRAASVGAPDSAPLPLGGGSTPASSAGSVARSISGVRWYSPKLVGRPSSLLPLEPRPRDLATAAEVALAEAEARSSALSPAAVPAPSAAGASAAASTAAAGTRAAAAAPSAEPLTAEQREAVALRLALPASVVARPPSFSTSASPPLAALTALLPPRAAGRDLRCLFSTSVHSWTREALTRHTRGVAPLLLVLRLALPRSRVSLASGPAAASAPTVGLFASDGVPSPPASGPARWAGTPSDFLFQLSPHVVCFPAQPPSCLYPAPGPAAGAAAESDSPAGAGAATGPAVSTRLRLSSERFLLATEAFLAVGGSPASTAAALRIPETFSRCSGSAELLFELGLLSARDVMAGTFGLEPELRLLGLEAFGFVDGAGSVQTSRGADGRFAAVTLRIVDEAEAAERERAAELAEQQARTYGGEASVAELRARVKRIVGDEEGARAADALLRQFEAKRAEAADRLAALRKSE